VRQGKLDGEHRIVEIHVVYGKGKGVRVDWLRFGFRFSLTVDFKTEMAALYSFLPFSKTGKLRFIAAPHQAANGQNQTFATIRN